MISREKDIFVRRRHGLWENRRKSWNGGFPIIPSNIQTHLAQSDAAWLGIRRLRRPPVLLVTLSVAGDESIVNASYKRPIQSRLRCMDWTLQQKTEVTANSLSQYSSQAATKKVMGSLQKSLSWRIEWTGRYSMVDALWCYVAWVSANILRPRSQLNS